MIWLKVQQNESEHCLMHAQAQLLRRLPSWRNLCSSARANTSSGRRGRLIESLAYILAVWGRETGPRGEKMAGGSQGTDSHNLATILNPFPAIFVDLGPDRISEI